MEVRDFIANIKELYKPALNDGQVPFYAKFLDRYVEHQLDELWEATVETHVATSPPSIGKLKEYAKDVTKLRVITQEDVKRKMLKDLTEEEIFSTELGMLSLQQGWSDSYYVVCKRDGIPDQGEQTHIWFQRGQSDAKNAARTLDEKNPLDAVLLKLHKSGLANNLHWRETYSHLIEN